MQQDHQVYVNSWLSPVLVTAKCKAGFEVLENKNRHLFWTSATVVAPRVFRWWQRQHCFQPSSIFTPVLPLMVN